MKAAPIYMPELTDAERLRIMRDNFESKNEKYHIDLSLDEIEERQQKLSVNSINIFKLENEKKEKVQEFKDKIDPLKEDNIKLMTEIDTGKKEEKGTLFFVPDFGQKLMITYDTTGRWVSERRLNPGEMPQHAIGFNGLRPAANDE